MRKASLLRQYLTEAEPFFKTYPERLKVFAEYGRFEATGTAAKSFRYHYTLNVLVLDYPHSLDNLMAPLESWLRRHQPDVLFNPDKRQSGVTFDADILNDDSADILLAFAADERVFNRDGQWVHPDDPDPDIITARAWPDKPGRTP